VALPRPLHRKWCEWWSKPEENNKHRNRCPGKIRLDYSRIIALFTRFIFFPFPSVRLQSSKGRLPEGTLLEPWARSDSCS
jgi:hypothetical protein